MTILFVCTGNTCRSPMAAALMRRALDKRKRKDIIIESAGLCALREPATSNAIKVISELDEKYAETLRSHISHQVSDEQLKKADLIAVMSISHASAVIERGCSPENVHILSAKDGSGGIPDPFGGDIEVYRKTRNQLEIAIESFADIVCQ